MINWTPRIEWTPERDAALMECIADGLTFVETGKVLQLTKDQIAARFRACRHAMGWQAQ